MGTNGLKQGINDLQTWCEQNGRMELMLEWNYQKNMPLTPNTVCAKARQRVWWKCSKNHEWQSNVCDRSRGRGCPECSKQKRATTRVTALIAKEGSLQDNYPNIAKEWHPIKNGDLKPTEVTAHSGLKAWWLCENGHEWESVIGNRTSGAGCPKCGIQKAQQTVNANKLVKRGSLQELNPSLASEWHPTKNGNITPSDVLPSSGKKFWWICSLGHEWEAIVSNRSKGSGCPFCRGLKAWAGYNDLLTVNPILAKEWHPSKNGELSPSDVTIGSNKRIWWLCENGHEWEATVHGRSSRGYGCPICGREKSIKSRQAHKQNKLASPQKVKKVKASTPYGIPLGRSLAEKCPEIAREWHPTKNGSKEPSMVFVGSSQKAWWLCPLGHSYDMRIASRTRSINKCGCPYCAVPAKRILKGFNDLETLYPNVVKEWHPTKNGTLLPSDFLPGSSKKVWWKCDKGHEWETSVSQRTKRNSQCPICSSEKKTSFPEQAVYYYVSKRFSDAVSRFRIGNYEVDIFIPSLNVGIEYDGQFYHTSSDAKKRESRKNEGLKKLGVNLIRIKENNTMNSINQHQILYKYDTAYKELPWAITKLFGFLGKSINTQDIDLVRDRSDIFSQYIQMEKENSLEGKYPALAKEWNYNRNGGIKPSMVSYSSNKRFWWICSLGHEWEATVGKRTSGRNCPICSNKKVLSGVNDLKTLNPEIASQWHPTKNGSLRPENVFPNYMKKVWWMCDSGHEWEATPNNRVRGRNCPFCSGKRIIQGVNDFQTQYPDLASEWHPTKNGSLLPSEVTSGSNRVILWICPKGHEWKTNVYNRVRGVNCSYCSGKRVTVGVSDLLSLYPNACTDWDYEKNNALGIYPSEMHPHSEKKVWWKCHKCGNEWFGSIALKVTADKHGVGNGCSICKKQLIAKSSAKKVRCVETGKVYNSLSSAIKETGCTSISSCVLGRCKTANGYHWEYIKE